MLMQTRDAELVNRFVNDPSVLPYVGFPEGTVRVDIAPLVEKPTTVVITDGRDAMMLLTRTAGNRWEKHNLFRAGCRGRHAITIGKAMLEYAFAVLGAVSVWAQPQVSNRAARWFNRQIGMISQGVGHDPVVGAVEIFERKAA